MVDALSAGPEDEPPEPLPGEDELGLEGSEEEVPEVDEDDELGAGSGGGAGKVDICAWAVIISAVHTAAARKADKRLECDSSLRRPLQKPLFSSPSS